MLVYYFLTITSEYETALQKLRQKLSYSKIDIQQYDDVVIQLRHEVNSINDRSSNNASNGRTLVIDFY